MKQPDTAALRERLANYTPEDELEQDKQELEGLLQEVNYQLIELRNLLKEVNAIKEELHGIHGSLKHTVQRERTAARHDPSLVDIRRYGHLYAGHGFGGKGILPCQFPWSLRNECFGTFVTGGTPAETFIRLPFKA